MSVTATTTGAPSAAPFSPLDRAQALASVRASADGREGVVLSVPGIKCGGCVSKIERALNARDDVASARVNLTLRQASVTFAAPGTDPLHEGP